MKSFTWLTGLPDQKVLKNKIGISNSPANLQFAHLSDNPSAKKLQRYPTFLHSHGEGLQLRAVCRTKCVHSTRVSCRIGMKIY